jgi:hypothetical protein
MNGYIQGNGYITAPEGTEVGPAEGEYKTYDAGRKFLVKVEDNMWQGPGGKVLSVELNVRRPVRKWGEL